MDMAISHKCSKLFLFLIFFFSQFIKVSLVDDTLQIFKGREIKVLGYQFPRILSYKKQKDGNYSFEGMFYELMQDVNVFFDIKTKYMVVDEDQVTKHGLNAVLFKHLDEKDIDFVPYPFEQDMSNLKHMELSATIYISPLKILQPWPAEQSRLTVTVRPFQKMVWGGFIGSTVLFIIVTSAFIKIKGKYGCNHEKTDTKKKSVSETIGSQIVYVLTILFNQGNSIPRQAKDSFRILVGLWLLSMVVLVNAYAGVLTSLLTVPKLEPIANTLQEAVAQNRKFTLEPNTTLITTFMDATGGYEKQIADQFRQDPTLFAKDPLSSIGNVLHRQCVLVTAELLVDFAINEDMKVNNRQCRMTSSVELNGYKSPGYQFGFPLGSPLVPAISKMFLRLNAAGVGDFYRKKYFPPTPKCRTDTPPETEAHSLSLFELGSAFLILGIGLSISILAFLMEITVKCFIGRKLFKNRVFQAN